VYLYKYAGRKRSLLRRPGKTLTLTHAGTAWGSHLLLEHRQDRPRMPTKDSSTSCMHVAMYTVVESADARKPVTCSAIPPRKRGSTGERVAALTFVSHV
jgi:hypothetical protein